MGRKGLIGAIPFACSCKDPGSPNCSADFKFSILTERGPVVRSRLIFSISMLSGEDIKPCSKPELGFCLTDSDLEGDKKRDGPQQKAMTLQCMLSFVCNRQSLTFVSRIDNFYSC